MFISCRWCIRFTPFYRSHNSIFKQNWGPKIPCRRQKPSNFISDKLNIKRNLHIHPQVPHIKLLKPTGYVMHHQFNIQQPYALPTLYLCVMYLSGKKTATCATYSINWLVYINVMTSVYSAVRTGSLNKAVGASSLKSLSENKQRFVPLTA